MVSAVNFDRNNSPVSKYPLGVQITAATGRLDSNCLAIRWREPETPAQAPKIDLAQRIGTRLDVAE